MMLVNESLSGKKRRIAHDHDQRLASHAKDMNATMTRHYTNPDNSKHSKRSIVVKDDHVVTGTANLNPNCTLNYAGCSRPGLNPWLPGKPNQDRLMMFEDHATETMIFACLDGHGTHGHGIAQFFTDQILLLLTNHPLYTSSLSEAIQDVLESIEQRFCSLNEAHAQMSGCTLCMMCVRGDIVTVCNIGDSRVVIGKKVEATADPLERGAGSAHAIESCESESCVVDSVCGLPTPDEAKGGTRRDSEAYAVHYVSTDHKPDHVSEHARITAAGGRVLSVKYADGTIGPARVWLGHAMTPGLAMSRSLGDLVAHSAGVSSAPDFHHIDIRSYTDCVCVLATDGLWDHVSAEEAIRVCSAADPTLAVVKLLKDSRRRWLADERVVDDTTICVVRVGQAAAR